MGAGREDLGFENVVVLLGLGLTGQGCPFNPFYSADLPHRLRIVVFIYITNISLSYNVIYS